VVDILRVSALIEEVVVPRLFAYNIVQCTLERTREGTPAEDLVSAEAKKVLVDFVVGRPVRVKLDSLLRTLDLVVLVPQNQEAVV
jgi:hypothetical protein